jgi:hypothetical protein
VRGLALALAATLWLGCAAATIPLDAMPAEPIAFLYRNVEETERLVDEMAARAKEQSARAAAESDADSGVERFDVEMEGLERLSGSRSAAERARDQRGRVALFVARERRLEVLDSVPAGARPIEWSTDRRLMFTWPGSGTFHLFEWDSRSGEVRQLTSGPEAQVGGSYGPAGALAYVQADRVGGKDLVRIWVRQPGEAPRVLTEGPLDVLPSWSPSGDRIVYTATDAGSGEHLRWVAPDGSARGKLGPGRAARFSRDGRWIVYTARTTAGWQLRRMRADGSGKRALGTSRYQEQAPAFSPDGRFVVFAGAPVDGSPVSRLFVRALDGGTDRQLEFAGSGLLPVW